MPTHRHAVSAGHTGCHVAAVALNAALAGRWRQAVATDGLGSSRLRPAGDHLVADPPRGLGRHLPDREVAAQEGFRPGGPGRGAAGHRGGGERHARAVARRRRREPRSSARVPGSPTCGTWVCELPEGVQRIPCGGTHLRSLDRARRARRASSASTSRPASCGWRTTARSAVDQRVVTESTQARSRGPPPPRRSAARAGCCRRSAPRGRRRTSRGRPVRPAAPDRSRRPRARPAGSSMPS